LPRVLVSPTPSLLYLFLPLSDYPYSCIVTSLIRLGYAVDYRVSPSQGAPFYSRSFANNILWALIETPVYILAGCMLCMGPLIRKAPTAIASRLASGGKSGGSSGAKGSKSSGPDSEQSKGSAQHKFWKLKGEPHSTTDEVVSEQDSWEMGDLNGQRRYAAHAV